jgi:adenylate cyclase
MTPPPQTPDAADRGAATAPPAAAAASRVSAQLGWTRSLRIHLGVLIVALLLAVATPLVWLAYEQGHETALDAARRQMDLLAERVSDRLGDLVAGSLAPVTLATVAEQLAPPADANLAAKQTLLLRMITASPEIDSAYVGYGDGGFIQAVLLDDDGWRRASAAPPAAMSAIRLIVSDGSGGGRHVWHFFDAQDQEIGFHETRMTSYDPRQRPWYRAAVAQAPRAAMSGPYTMATTGTVGISLSRVGAFGDGAVVGVDVLLDTISRFLAEARLSQHAQAFVFDRRGRLIVHSNRQIAAQLAEAIGTRDGMADLRVMPEAKLMVVAQGLIKDRKPGEAMMRSFDHDGQAWLMHMSGGGGGTLAEGATVVVAAPESDFTGDTIALLQQGVGIALGVLAAGILAALLVAVGISRSLAALTRQAKRFEALDLAPGRPINSHISEVMALSSAMSAARNAVRTFALYVPSEVVRLLVGGGLFGARLAERREVTVLFTDIRDFTTICETAEPEEVVAMLSAYFDVMSGCIRDHGGAIIQFLGDSVYAMWNAPIEDGSHADHALACALSLAARIGAFNARQVAAGKPALVTRFGLHTGTAVVGSMGAADRLQYTAIGDTVNVASRLEGINKEFGTTILASRQLKDRATGPFRFRPLGEVQAKGRAEPIEIFEVMAGEGANGSHDADHGIAARQVRRRGYPVSE